MGMLYAKMRRPVPPDECAICLEPMVHMHDVVKPECGHRFHLDCLVEAQRHKNACPLCRAPIGVVKWALPYTKRRAHERAKVIAAATAKARSRPVLRHAEAEGEE